MGRPRHRAPPFMPGGVPAARRRACGGREAQPIRAKPPVGTSPCNRPCASVQPPRNPRAWRGAARRAPPMGSLGGWALRAPAARARARAPAARDAAARAVDAMRRRGGRPRRPPPPAARRASASRSARGCLAGARRAAAARRRSPRFVPVARHERICRLNSRLPRRRRVARHWARRPRARSRWVRRARDGGAEHAARRRQPRPVSKVLLGCWVVLRARARASTRRPTCAHYYCDVRMPRAIAGRRLLESYGDCAAARVASSKRRPRTPPRPRPGRRRRARAVRGAHCASRARAAAASPTPSGAGRDADEDARSGATSGRRRPARGGVGLGRRRRARAVGGLAARARMLAQLAAAPAEDAALSRRAVGARRGARRARCDGGLDVHLCAVGRALLRAARARNGDARSTRRRRRAGWSTRRRRDPRGSVRTVLLAERLPPSAVAHAQPACRRSIARATPDPRRRRAPSASTSPHASAPRIALAGRAAAHADDGASRCLARPRAARRGAMATRRTEPPPPTMRGAPRRRRRSGTRLEAEHRGGRWRPRVAVDSAREPSAPWSSSVASAVASSCGRGDRRSELRARAPALTTAASCWSKF